METKVSVIIPVYNLEDYLDEGIQSILKQTLEDIEIIAVNDGSTDNSVNILKKYKRNDKRVSLINLTENRGQSVARNEGLIKACGKYVYFFDGDDILKDNALEVLFNDAERYSLDIVNFDADIFYHDESLDFNPNYSRNNKIPNKMFNGKDYFDYLVFNSLLTVSVPLNFIRRNFLIENNLKFIEGIIHEDDIYITNLYIEAKKIKHINKALYKRRIRPNSTMTTKKSSYNLISYITIINELKEVYFEKHKSESVKLRVNTIFSNILYLSYDIGLYKDYKDEIKSLFKELKNILNAKTKLKYRVSGLYYFYINYRKKYNL